MNVVQDRDAEDEGLMATDPTWKQCDCEHCRGRRAFESTQGITREMAINALINLHASIRGEECPRDVAIGCATSAVMQLKRERDELLTIVKVVAEWKGDPCLCGGRFPKHEPDCVWLHARAVVEDGCTEGRVSGRLDELDAVTFTKEQLERLRAMYKAPDSPTDAQAGYIRQLLATIEARDELREKYLQNMFHADGTGPGMVIMQLRDEVARFEGETLRWRESYRTLEAERDELRAQNNEYHASADASGQTALMSRAAEMERMWREADERTEKAERERNELRELLRSGFAYVRDANRLMAEDGDLDEEDEDGANEWMEKAAAALVDGS